MMKEEDKRDPKR